MVKTKFPILGQEFLANYNIAFDSKFGILTCIPLVGAPKIQYTVKSRVLTRVTNLKNGVLGVIIYETGFKTRCGSIVIFFYSLSFS